MQHQLRSIITSISFKEAIEDIKEIKFNIYYGELYKIVSVIDYLRVTATFLVQVHIRYFTLHSFKPGYRLQKPFEIILKQ